MSQASTRHVVDCDTHFWQPLERWEGYLEPAHKDAVVAFFRENDGMKSVDPEVRKVIEERMAEPAGDDARARLAWMDASGLSANIIYPGAGLVAYAPEPQVARAASRALNRFAADFADADRSRLKPCLTLPWRFPELALDELRHASEALGLEVVFAAPTPDPERRWSDPAFDPLWREMQARELVLTFHEFTRVSSDMQLVARPCYRDSYALSYLCGHSVEAQLAVMDVIGGGMLERFPELSVGFVEAHVAWLPGWLALMDSIWPRISSGYKSSEGTGTLAHPASEYFRRQCFIVAFPDDAWIPEVLRYVGEDNLTFCTDFPHPQTREEPERTLRERHAALGEATLAKVLGGNAARIFHLD
ncbi:MAG: amidohydrolase family protein [Myxococcales bacterium]|nr:amidohydrolase family protein [Myxococcales bacterium]